MDQPSHTVHFIGDDFITIPFAINALHTVRSNGLLYMCRLTTFLQYYPFPTQRAVEVIFDAGAVIWL